MLPTEDLFVQVYVMIDDAIASGAVVIPPRPGPAPACSDAELVTIAMARHLLSRRSEAGFLAEVARDFGYLFPVLPHQSEANRRIRWLWGAFEQVRGMLAARLPEDDCQQITRGRPGFQQVQCDLALVHRGGHDAPGPHDPAAQVGLDRQPEAVEPLGVRGVAAEPGY